MLEPQPAVRLWRLGTIYTGWISYFYISLWRHGAHQWLSAEAKVIPARGQGLIDTQISVMVPPGTYGRVAPRSGLGESRLATESPPPPHSLRVIHQLRSSASTLGPASLMLITAASCLYCYLISERRSSRVRFPLMSTVYSARLPILSQSMWVTALPSWSSSASTPQKFVWSM